MTLRAVARTAAIVALLAPFVSGAPAGAAASLEFDRAILDLPGPPSRVVPADLDGDGRTELAIVVAYTEIESIGDDRIEDLVQISVVIPAVFDRRELRVYGRTPTGFELVAPPMPLPVEVLHLEGGPPGAPLVALTDDGLDAVRLRRDPSGDARLERETLIRQPTALAGSETFQAGLRVLFDVDGDGLDDVLLPTARGYALYLWEGSAPTSEPVSEFEVPGDQEDDARGLTRSVPVPAVQDVDGDGVPDLVVRNWRRWHVLLGTGAGSFVPFRDPARDCHDGGSDLRFAGVEPGLAPWPEGMTALRDLDGDGRAEAVLEEALERPGDGMRAELKDAKRPRVRYDLHRLDDALDLVAEPYASFVAEGHDFGESGGDDAFPLAFERFVDLDGDRREELVTVTLDFSVFQAIRVLATKRISIGTDFHVYHQQSDGAFREVEGLDLSEKLKFDLDDLSLGRFAQFAGDFDGDGRQDFVHLGRGREVTIHRGQDGARYPAKPDRVLELDAEPDGLELVRIEDLDGDGRSDLRVTRPIPSTDPDVTAPVRLELHLSGERP